MQGAYFLTKQRDTRAGLAGMSCATAMAVGVVPIYIGTFSVFLKPVSMSFGWGLATFPQALLISSIVVAVSAPVAGRLSDRFGARAMALPGIMLFSAALLLLSYMHGSRIELYGIAALAGVSGAMAGPVAFIRVISGWFDRSRGLVLGLIFSAAPGLATAAIVPWTRFLIAAEGWQPTYRILALVVAVVGLPMVALFMREPVAATAMGGGAAGSPKLTEGIPTSRALRQSYFWILLAATCLVTGTVSGVQAHLITWMTGSRVSSQFATWLVSLLALSGMAAPVLAGALVDRVTTQRVLLLFYIVPLTGMLLLINPVEGKLRLIAGALMLGFGSASVTGLLPYLTTRYFGLRASSEIFGIALGVVSVAIGSGPVLIGLGFDHLGDYHWPMMAVAGCLAAGLLLISLLGAYRFHGSGARRPRSGSRIDVLKTVD
jgi:MFS family permease